MKRYTCPQCGFDLWIPIVSLNICHVGFYDDARFPGRLIVALNDHHEHLDEMPADAINEFIHEIQQVSRVLRQVTGCARVNMCVLGNAEPHVHAHLIPRYPHAEQYPTKSPWDDPRPRVMLEKKDKDHIVEQLRESFASW